MATKIELALSDELSASWDLTDPDHHVKVRPVGSGDNTFEVKEDGMYVSAKPGPDGQGGTGYDDYYTNEGLRLGYESPYSDQRAQRKICGMHYLHRLFDATIQESSDPQVPGIMTPTNFRPEIDYVLAGDMCRVDQGNGTWKYYLVTGTDPSGLTTEITSYEELGVW